MDAADRAILRVLAANARASIKKLAEAAFLSSPAASVRLERLEKKGYIKSYQAQLDYPALGYQILAFVQVETPPSRKQEFQDLMQAWPNVLECHHVTGEYSMLAKAAFHSTRELSDFVEQMQKFGTTRTQVVFSTLVEPRQLTD